MGSASCMLHHRALFSQPVSSSAITEDQHMFSFIHRSKTVQGTSSCILIFYFTRDIVRNFTLDPWFWRKLKTLNAWRCQCFSETCLLLVQESTFVQLVFKPFFPWLLRFLKFTPFKRSCFWTDYFSRSLLTIW